VGLDWHRATVYTIGIHRAKWALGLSMHVYLWDVGTCTCTAHTPSNLCLALCLSSCVIPIPVYLSRPKSIFRSYIQLKSNNPACICQCLARIGGVACLRCHQAIVISSSSSILHMMLEKAIFLTPSTYTQSDAEKWLFH
jgi:hypothetical protein